MIISLTKREMEFISKVGFLRTEENKNKRDIADYRKEAMKMTSLQANRLGVMGEAGLVKALGYDLTKTPLDIWPSFYITQHKSLYAGADVKHEGKNLEVRRVNKRDNPLAIRPKDIQEETSNVKVFIDYTFDEVAGKVHLNSKAVEIVGWIDSAEGWDKGTKPWWATPDSARVVDDEDLNPIDLLLSVGVAA